MMWDDDGRWEHMHDGGAGWVMLVLMLVLVAAAVVAVIALLRGTTSPPTPPAAPAPRAADPRAILQERFARGELDESDFRARMRALDDTSP